MKKILLILTALLLSVMLTACETVVNCEGTYTLKKIYVDGNTVKEGDKLWDETYGDDGGMIIELKENGEGIIKMTGSSEESFEYAIDGETITMINEGDIIGGTIKSNEIEFKNWKSESLIFEKIDLKK